MSPPLLDLAKRLENRLTSGLVDQPLCAQLRAAIGSASTAGLTKDKALALKYDDSAVKIWNATLSASRNDGGNVGKALPLTRAFAFVLLRASYAHSGEKTGSKHERLIRLLRTALKVGKTCIDSAELDLATEMLQISADHVSFFTNMTDGPQAVRQCAGDLVTEYWLLRATLSWKQNRLDLAEMHFAKVADAIGAGATVRLKTADIAYEIAKQCLATSRIQDCILWCEQASRAIDRIPQDDLISDAVELRMAISRDLARALMKEKTESALSRAADLISYLESEQGPQLTILTLKTDLLFTKEPADAGAYSIIIGQMVNAVTLDESAFTLVLGHIRKLHALSTNLASDALRAFVITRLFAARDKSLVERAVILYMWMIVDATNDTGVASVVSLLDDTHAALEVTFDAKATHAAQTLCWKGIEAAIRAHSHDLAEQWCRLGMHNLFDQAGDVNKSKLARKLMTVALLDGRTGVAREAFFQMPQAGQESPMSQYLLYRVALREGDDALVSQCMATLSRSPNTDPDLLYACAQEAQQHNSRKYAILALDAILKRTDSGRIPGVRLPVLARCMVQMLLGEINDNVGAKGEHLDDIIRLLVHAAASWNTDEEQGKDTPVIRLEAEWFARTAYNIIISHMAILDATRLLQLVDACVEFCKRSQPDKHEANLAYTSHSMTCQYIGACVCVSSARSEDRLSASKKHYTDLLKYSKAWKALYSTYSHGTQEDECLANRKSQMLRFEIEALFQTKQHEKLDAILEEASSLTANNHLDLLADLLISIHSVMMDEQIGPSRMHKVASTMLSIVDASTRISDNLVKLSRWLRCVFRMTATTSPEIALRVLALATDIAASNDGLHRLGKGYPASELEWLAGTAFNTAVDRHCASDEDGCRVWGEAALNLAGAATQSPRLYAQMQGLWMRLQSQQYQR